MTGSYVMPYDPEKLTPEQLRAKCCSEMTPDEVAQLRLAHDLEIQEAIRTGAEFPTDLVGPYTSRPEPSELVRASPSLMESWRGSVTSSEEIERRAHRAKALGEAMSAIELHSRRAERDPDYWVHLYHSRVMS